MRILQLCNKPPNPPTDGGCIAMNNITHGLIESGHQVKVLAIETHKHKLRSEDLSNYYRKHTGIESVFVDTKINIIDAFSSLVTSDSYNISRFFSPDFDIKLTSLLQREKFDVVQLESLFMTPYIGTIRRLSKSKIILRSHNLEYIIWERMAQFSKNKAKRTYLKLLAKQLKKYEMSVINEVDGIAAISIEDEKKYQKLGCRSSIVTIPFGLNIENYTPVPNHGDDLSLFHLGSMDWLPNLEGVNWFLNEIWDKIHHDQPDLKLYLAGRKMPKSFKTDEGKNCEVIGEVDDANEFMNSKSIMLVPLLSAGGMRVKIIEGMALGKTIVSTKVGAEGIDYETNENILIADTPDEFVKIINELAEDKEKCAKIGKSARVLIEEKYDNKILTEKLINFYKEILDS